jgi:hypothetical protein
LDGYDDMAHLPVAFVHLDVNLCLEISVGLIVQINLPCFSGRGSNISPVVFAPRCLAGDSGHFFAGHRSPVRDRVRTIFQRWAWQGKLTSTVM